MHIRKGLEGYHWKNVGMHWILSYLDLCIAAHLQVLRVIPTQLSFNSVKVGFFSLLGLGVAVVNILPPSGCCICVFEIASTSLPTPWSLSSLGHFYMLPLTITEVG